MIAKCPCDHCGENIEFSSEEFLSGSSVVCPHCGKETLLCVSRQAKPAPQSPAPASKPPQRFTAPARSKIPTVVWTVTGVFILCALCLTAFLIGKNSQRRSDQTSEGKPETVESKPKSDPPQFLQNLKDKQETVKKVAFPPQPTSGMEFFAKLLENFPERVVEPGKLEGKIGWMDAEFGDISSDFIEDYYLPDGMVGFTVEDKDGNSFYRCYAEKSKLGDSVLGLKRYEEIRISGQAMLFRMRDADNTFDVFFRVDSIQVIK
jgi:hypothetical protein